MAKQELPVDFKDDVLQAEMAGKRKYRIIQNEDGTISLEDVTNYSQIGSNFGAAQMNATNLAVNESFDKNKVIDSLVDIVANEATGYAAGALAVRELNGNKVSGWGDPEKVSNPYTPNVDGLIRIYFSPSGNANATVYATQNGISHFSTSSAGGGNIAQFFPVKSGHTYQGQASQPGTIQLAFIPLRTE